MRGPTTETESADTFAMRISTKQRSLWINVVSVTSIYHFVNDRQGYGIEDVGPRTVIEPLKVPWVPTSTTRFRPATAAIPASIAATMRLIRLSRSMVRIIGRLRPWLD